MNFQLGGKKEKRVLDLISQHLAMARRCSKELTQLISSIQQQNWTLVKDQSEIISRCESMADDLHRESVIQIAQGAFFAGMREDFLDLLEQVDEIADASQDAARVIAEAPVDPRILDYLFSGNSTLSGLSEAVDSCVAALVDSVESLRKNAEQAVSISLEVERMEEVADQIKAELITKLSQHRQQIEVLTYLQLKEFIFRLDDVADAAENSSDLVITIAVKAVS